MESISVVRALRTLTPKQEKALRLMYAVGCDRRHSPEEIAQEYNVSVSEMRRLIAGASDRLRRGTGVGAKQLIQYGRHKNEIDSAILLASFPNRSEQIEVESAVTRLLAEIHVSRQHLLELTPRQFEELVAEIWT